MGRLDSELGEGKKGDRSLCQHHHRHIGANSDWGVLGWRRERVTWTSPPLEHPPPCCECRRREVGRASKHTGVLCCGCQPSPLKKVPIPFTERHSLWMERLCNHRCLSRREPPLGWWGLLIKDLLLVLYGAEIKRAAVGAGIEAPQRSTSGTCLWVQGDGWWMLFSLLLFICQLHL